MITKEFQTFCESTCVLCDAAQHDCYYLHNMLTLVCATKNAMERDTAHENMIHWTFGYSRARLSVLHSCCALILSSSRFFCYTIIFISFAMLRIPITLYHIDAIISTVCWTKTVLPPHLVNVTATSNNSLMLQYVHNNVGKTIFISKYHETNLFDN